MTMWEIDFSYKIPEYGSVELEATDADQAEALGMQFVRDTYDEITDITIDGVKEVDKD